MTNIHNDDSKEIGVDKVEDYFKTKSSISNLRRDLKDHRSQLDDAKELEKLNKKVKELRENIKSEETIHDLSERISAQRERLELLKELIRIELLETSQDEVKRNGRKLKLISIIREMKDQEDKSKGNKPVRPLFRN